jgi:hypothetical protein
LIINIISLAVFAFSYFYVYAGFVKKTDAADKEAEQNKQIMQEQTKKLAEEETVRQDTVTVNDQIQEILDGYPVYIAKEDNYIFIDQMQKALNSKFTSVNISDVTEFKDTGLPIRGNDGTTAQSDSGAGAVTDAAATDTSAAGSTGTEAAAANTTATDPNAAANTAAGTETAQTMKIMQTTITMGFSTSYEGFKDMVDYIKNYPDKTIIDSTAVSYDGTTGGLTGSLVLKRFAMTGTGKEYVAPVVDDISIGTDNIFGTSPDNVIGTTPDQAAASDQIQPADLTGEAGQTDGQE